MPELKERNNLLDSFRLLAAFAVMHLHTQLGDIGYEWSSIVRFGCRWAVPFFFISAGHYLAIKNEKSTISILSIRSNLINLIGILIIASAVYIIFAWLSGYMWFHNDVKYLFIGSFWHIWFIGSMIFAYIMLWFIDEVLGRRLLYICGTITLLGCIIISEFSFLLPLKISYEEIPRFISGFAFMTLGMLLSKINFSQVNRFFLLTLAIISLCVVFIELYVGKIGNYINLYQIELSLGSSLLAITLFICSQVLTTEKNMMSVIGKRYSLFIYLYHILIFKMISKIFVMLKINPDSTYIFFPLLALASLLLGVYSLEKKAPKLLAVLNGKMTNGVTTK